jgi:hypothetical protein
LQYNSRHQGNGEIFGCYQNGVQSCCSWPTPPNTLSEKIKLLQIFYSIIDSITLLTIDVNCQHNITNEPTTHGY